MDNDALSPLLGTYSIVKVLLFILEAKQFYTVGLYRNCTRTLLTANPEYKEVFNESNTFWSLKVRALYDATLSCLCRAYDQHSKPLSLKNLIATIEANLEIFDTANFKERLRGNPFVESLTQTVRRPNDLSAINL